MSRAPVGLFWALPVCFVLGYALGEMAGWWAIFVVVPACAMLGDLAGALDSSRRERGGTP